MFYQHEDLHFECTRCGRCCATGGDYYVFLGPGEAETIRRHLGLSRSWFRRRYLAWDNAGERVLASRAGGSCVLLDEQGHCGIYPARPAQCRTYPFWPELVARKSAWQKERQRCEGIDRGPAVPRERIEAALTALKVSDE